MSLDGLQVILDKEEIIHTQRAQVFLEDTDAIETLYLQYLRAYVPFGHRLQNTSGGVAQFVRRVVQRIKEKGALCGYITAEYGHGKTNTALYLWDYARNQNVLTVPPFQLGQLSDLVTATYGWFRHEIERTRPGSNLLDEAEILYRGLMNRSAESLAEEIGIEKSAAQQVVRYRPTFLEITPDDYVRFFSQITHLAHSAGYDGVLVIADEVQQYIEQEVKGGFRDPIGSLFDIVSGVLGRAELDFGLMLVIPPKDLAILNDQRNDLVQRASQASLDLSTIIDHDFPRQLWVRLAQEFGFEEHSSRIVTSTQSIWIRSIN